MKEALSIAAILLTLSAFLPYLFSILHGSVRPHVFSWVIWGSTTFIVFLAQLQDGGGLGAWPIGLSGSIAIVIAVLAYLKKADNSITSLDWVFFIVALSSLPLWYFANEPFWAVLILTGVDLFGFGPTLRKAFHAPFEENLLFYLLFAVRNALSMFALEHYSATTLLWPLVTGLGCLVLIGLLVYRRRVLVVSNE